MRTDNEDLPIDPDFDGSELLFRFVKPTDMLGDIIDPNHQAWDIPACSVNREKYSNQPILSVVPPTWGYAQCAVSSLPPALQSTDGGMWEALPIHLPVKANLELSILENLAHSEVRLHRDGIFIDGKKPYRPDRKYWKNELSQAFKVIVKPRNSI